MHIPSTSTLLLSHLTSSHCTTINHLNPFLARLIIPGLLRYSPHLCHLVDFLTSSTNPNFLAHASVLIDHYSYPSNATFLYNKLIKAYGKSKYPQNGILVYSKMLGSCIVADTFTFPILVKSVSISPDTEMDTDKHASISRNIDAYLGRRSEQGRLIHCHIIKRGFKDDVFVVNTLVNMYFIFIDSCSARKVFDDCMGVLDIVSWNTLIDGYAKLGELDLARELFERMPERNDISWTSMISGYVKNGDLDVAQGLFDKMDEKVCRNPMTWNSIISGFAKNGLLVLARKMFDDMPCKNIVSWNTMVSAYACNGELKVARGLFDEMGLKDVFTWSCMISGYAQNDKGDDALKLFKEMLAENCTRPNEVTLMSVLSVCGHLALLDQGKWVHSYIDKNGFKVSGNLGAALIDMYAKCGCVDIAVEVFQKINNKNMSTWNALITGYAVNGLADKALEVFSNMLKLDMKPDNVTFLAVLMACCHGGLVEEGQRYFESMSNTYDIQPEMKHYGCIVDLLGRAGLIQEAKEIVKSMRVKPDVRVLGALFGACRIHGETLVADRLRKDFLRMNSREAGCHVLLSNIYAAAGSWAEAFSSRSTIVTHEIIKGAGLSSVELPDVEL